MSMKRRINLERALREIQDTIVPAVREEKKQVVREWVEGEMERLEASVAELTTECDSLRLHPGCEPGARLHARGKLIIGLLLLVVDVPLQFALNVAAFPQVSWWAWAIAAPAFAFGLGGIVHGAAASLYDPVRPARSIRVVRGLAWGTFALAGLAFSILMFVRVASVQTAAYLMDLASASTWILTETAPVAGGCFVAWWYFLCAPSTVAAQKRNEEARLNELRRLKEQLDGGAASRQNATERSPLREHIPRVATLGLAALIVSASPSTATAQRAACALAVDVTASVDSVHRAEGTRAILNTVQPMTDALRCGTMLVTWYADEGPWAPRRQLAVPAKPGDRACAGDSNAVHGTKALLGSFAAYSELYATEARRKCAAVLDSLRARYREEWSEFVTRLTDILSRLRAKGRSTDIAGVIGSLDVDVVVDVTDGLARQSAAPRGAFAKTPPRHILILIPAGEAYGGRAATEAAAERWKASGAIVVPYTWLASAEIWAQLAGRR